MKTLTLKLPRPHPAQAQVLDERKRFNVLNCGRRFGKTTMGIDLLAAPMLLAGKPVAFYSPTYKMLSDVWRDFKRSFSPVIANKSEQEHRIELITGGTLDMWSLEDPDSSRGRKYARIFIDEAAKVRKLEEAWTQVIRPTLADYAGDAFFASTPKGLNYFFTLWQRAGDSGQGTDSDWARWQFPTAANPYIRRSEIVAMKAELPERVYLQEILAEFIADGTFFQNIDRAAVIDQPDQPDQHSGHHIVMGIDWALHQDYTVLTVVCRECNRVVDWERFNQIDFTYQRERVWGMAKRWHMRGVLPERNSIGEPNIELLREHMPILSGPDEKPGFNTTSSTKPGLIQGLAVALEHEGFKVPKDYGDELRAYEVETLLNGHPKFGAPEGQHDDRVISLALAWYALGRYSPLPAQPIQRSKWTQGNVETGEESRWHKF